MSGQQIKPYVHAGGHLCFEGEGELLQDGQAAVPIAPEKVLLAPAGESYGVLNSGSQGLVLVCVSAG